MDIKEHSSQLKSNFYKQHLEQAGKEGLPVFLGYINHYSMYLMYANIIGEHNIENACKKIKVLGKTHA